MASLRLDKEIERRLDRLAAVTGRTKSFYIRRIIEDHIDELEDRYIGEARLEYPGERLSDQEMRRELGLEG